MKHESKTNTKRTFRSVLSLLITAQLVSSTVYAQFDDEEFPPPPPPPPMMGEDASQGLPFNRVTAPKGNPAATLKTTSKEPTTKEEKQKNKFSAAGIEDINNENFPETIESFDFPNAEITDIVKAISELTGKNFIIDPSVRGKITIVAPSKITVAEAYKAFLSSLAINGFAVVPSGKFLKIRSARNAQRDGIETYSGSYYPNADQMITRIIHLKHISAEMVNRDLRILTSKDGELSPYTPTNSVIVSDYGSNIERIMKIISQLDVPGFEDQLEVVPVRYAKAKDIGELVNKIVNKGDSRSQNAGGFSAGVPRFSQPNNNNSKGSSSAYFVVFPDDRTNSLIIVGNKAGIARVRKLVSQLDFRIRADESGGFHVYYVKYGDAEKIAQTLSGIAKDAAPKPQAGGLSGFPGAISPTAGVVAPQEIFGGDVKITADKGTNSLVVVASKQDYETVLNLLGKIDIPRDQVFVESVIMEMKITDGFKWEIGYFNYSRNSDGTAGPKAGFNGIKDLTGLLGATGGNGAILGFGTGSEVSITSGSTTTKIPSLVGFINFLKNNANANVLSTPQILALDNQEATIEVGDKVITGVNTTTSTTGTQSTPIFEDATIKLKIKPIISPASNTIRMEIENSVKQLSTAKTPDALTSVTQPLATRSIKTSIVVPNGDTAVLGGLMKEDDIEQIQKVPLLGDIPIIGWLFKSRNSSKEKTNLLVFLTPKIIRNAEDSKDILTKKIDQRLRFIKDMGGRDPYGEKIDEIQGVRAGKPSGNIKK